MPWVDKKMLTVQGKTRVVGIIGDPIQHSLSPLMQNAAFVASHLDYIYVPFAVSPVNLEQAVNGLKALGVCGFNVTIPHKSTIIPFLDRLDITAEAAGAVNTVHLSGTSLIGYNTDGAGLIDSLSSDLDFYPGIEQIVVVGSGGAARGAISALCSSGAKRILICNRSYENARSVVNSMRTRYPDTYVGIVSNYEIIEEELAATSLLINTTSLGMNGERLDNINISQLPEHAKVLDMVYSRSCTPLMKDASALGLRAIDGLGMLIAQGERAFKIWTGIKPPEGVMRQALNGVNDPTTA